MSDLKAGDWVRCCDTGTEGRIMVIGDLTHMDTGRIYRDRVLISTESGIIDRHISLVERKELQ